ncbi:MAG: hypothetical protein AB1767_12470 [Bacillota bacterium]
MKKGLVAGKLLVLTTVLGLVLLLAANPGFPRMYHLTPGRFFIEPGYKLL